MEKINEGRDVVEATMVALFGRIIDDEELLDVAKERFARHVPEWKLKTNYNLVTVRLNFCVRFLFSCNYKKITLELTCLPFCTMEIGETYFRALRGSVRSKKIVQLPLFSVQREKFRNNLALPRRVVSGIF